MSDALHAKLHAAPPRAFTAEEEAALRETLRHAMATTLDLAPDAIADDARIFADLGLDSIDVFDLLDQLGDAYGITVTLEALPEALLRGSEALTFRAFADLLLAHLREGPLTAEDGAPG